VPPDPRLRLVVGRPGLGIIGPAKSCRTRYRVLPCTRSFATSRRSGDPRPACLAGRQVLIATVLAHEHDTAVERVSTVTRNAHSSPTQDHNLAPNALHKHRKHRQDGTDGLKTDLMSSKSGQGHGPNSTMTASLTT
jgi:hypothetical protein